MCPLFCIFFQGFSTRLRQPTRGYIYMYTYIYIYIYIHTHICIYICFLIFIHLYMCPLFCFFFQGFSANLRRPKRGHHPHCARRSVRPQSKCAYFSLNINPVLFARAPVLGLCFLDFVYLCIVIHLSMFVQ